MAILQLLLLLLFLVIYILDKFEFKKKKNAAIARINKYNNCIILYMWKLILNVLEHRVIEGNIISINERSANMLIVV